MRRLRTWTGRLVGSAGVLLLLAVAVVYGGSELLLRRTYVVPLTLVAVPADSQSIATGRRLARTRGCTTCHGLAAEGRVFLDEPLLGRYVAPDLTRVVRRRSDAELERVIRHGVHADGTSTVIMPSAMYARLSDGDLGAILGFLRSLPPSDGLDMEIRPGPLDRLGVLTGRYRLQASLIDHNGIRASAPPADTVAHGRYLALTSCTECHGPDLRGDPGGFAPDLSLAAAYPDTAFVRLMRTGMALGGRELRLMTGVAQRRFSQFTDAEVAALHRFLKTLDSARVSPSPR